VYVSGNLFIYYEEGKPKAVIAPDVFVVLGVDNRNRRIYKLWEEGNKAPDFVLEITSKKTKKEDCEIKPNIYANLGVREYFQYDPTGDYLNPQLQGFQLREGIYQPINSTALPNSVLSISSEVLNLELRLIAGELRFFNPLTAQMLLTHEEEMQARLSAEERSQRLAAKLRELNIDPDAF
jgi:Uma2 family endonuclease